MAHFRSSTLDNRGKRPAAFNCLMAFITTAKRCLVSDAHISNRACSFLAQCGKKAHLFVNTYVPAMPRVEYYDSFCEWQEDVMNYWSGPTLDKSFTIVSSSNRIAKWLHDQLLNKFPTKRILLINSECDDNLKSFATNKEMWRTCSCVIYTSTVGCGLDIDLKPPHFFTSFIYGTPYTNTPNGESSSLFLIPKQSCCKCHSGFEMCQR